VVDDDRDPPAERPALRQREGEPRNPEAGGGRYDGQIGVPDVIGSIGGNAPGGGHGFGGRRYRGGITDWRFPANTADCRGGQVQARAGQDLRDFGNACIIYNVPFLLSGCPFIRS